MHADLNRPVTRAALVESNTANAQAALVIGISLMDPEIEVEISDTQGHLRVDPAALDRSCAACWPPRAARARRSRSPWSITRRSTRSTGRIWATTGRRTSSASRSPSPTTRSWPASWSSPPRWRATTRAEIGVEPGDELALYVVHGLLHLCGYDDHDDAERDAMRRREDELLARAGLTNPVPSASRRDRDRVTAGLRRFDPLVTSRRPAMDGMSLTWMLALGCRSWRSTSSRSP